jgi:hypothetical protein
MAGCKSGHFLLAHHSELASAGQVDRFLGGERPNDLVELGANTHTDIASLPGIDNWRTPRLP